MSWLDRLSNLLHRNELSSDIDEELQFHIDSQTRDNLTGGMTAEAAQRDARRRFGNRTLAKEKAHEMNIFVALETVGQDIRYALRSLYKTPGFTTLAILALALGIGANTAVFTVVDGVLLRPLPFAEPDRLFLVSYNQPAGGSTNQLGLDDKQYPVFERETRAFERVTTFGRDTVTLTGTGEPVRIPVAAVTASFFPVLGVNPAIGRTLSPEEERPEAAGTAILSNELWRKRFRSDPNILQKTVTVNGVERSVIGVMPAGFTFPDEASLWLPLAIGADPGNSYFRPVFGRLRSSASEQNALAELQTLAAHFPATPGNGQTGKVAAVLPLQNLLTGEIWKSLLVFMGAVGFVLLIACANVANLLLMRGSLRQQEMAVRTALGANRRRLIRQLLTESIVISLGGAIAGILLAVFGVRALLALAPAGRVPRIEAIHMDGRVLAFAIGLGVLTGILFGLLPALQGTGRELRAFLGQMGRAVTGRREGMRGALVVSEIALTLVLLTGAGLLLKSFLRMRDINPGFRPENILTMTVDLPESTYKTTPAIQAFHATTLEKLSHLPGVISAAAVNWLPLNGALIRGDFHLGGGRKLPQGYAVDKPAVSPEYFSLMGIRLLSGRRFDGRDSATSPHVAIVSQSVAQTLWPGGDAIGKQLTLEDHPNPEDWLTIVGIVADVRQVSLTETAHAALYQPYTQVKRPFFLSHMTFEVRTAARPENMAAAMRSVLQEVDRNQPVQTIAAMTDLVSATTAEPRFQARLISIFAMLALLLAAIGVYGVLACAVTERTREIGIRMALGAAGRDVTRMILKRSLLLVGSGVGLGLAGALAITHVLSKFLFDVKPTDPPTFVLVAALLVAVGLLAGVAPVRRATTVDPLSALRWE